jgi:hypothetical protein
MSSVVDSDPDPEFYFFGLSMNHVWGMLSTRFEPASLRRQKVLKNFAIRAFT